MPRLALHLAAVFTVALALAPRAARAQSITTPPSGDNQRASVMQGIGLVEVRIDYSSPDVHGPNGEDRSGKIWGGLVPYGLSDLGFNNCTSCPWRAGANETTVFSASHDVLVEGKPLAAGSYGLHMIPGKDEWTIIFSKRAKSWGSFFYDPAEDALRVNVKPRESEYHEWLTYEFTDRRPDRATVALQWERLQVPISIQVDDITGKYVERIRDELRTGRGFQSADLVAGAQYCLQNRRNLGEALQWAQQAVSAPFVGSETFQTLTTLAQAQLANDQNTEAQKTVDRAMTMTGVTVLDVHGFGRQLQLMGKHDHALRVFQANAKKFPGQWPTTLGLARGYAGVGEVAKAREWGVKALAAAPNEANKRNVQSFLDGLAK
jgi:tetratricopeptide (TPR) repeat protein